MKRLKRKIYLVIVMLVLITPACNDYLTIEPENELIKDKFWTKGEDVQSALAATYDAFRDASLESFIWGELRADICKFGTQFPEYREIAGSNIRPSNKKIDWSKYYEAINLANTLMYFDDDVLNVDESFTEEIMNAFEAEALFIRSLSYFYLIRIWKEVPLVLEPSISDEGDLFLPKTSEKEVIKQIISDLLLAKDMAYTDEFADIPAYYKGRANKYSIMALLADVYLWDEQYQNSINYCDSIIKTGKFGLESNSTWFSLYNPGNSMTESIFEIQFDDNYDKQENPIYTTLIPVSGSVQLTFNTNQMNLLFNKDDIRLCGTNKPHWKYLGVDSDTKVKRTASQRDANFIYYRYADILLIKADALVETGKFIEANDLLRKTIERAGLTHIDVVSKRELQKAVRDEKAREFVAEGKRWFHMLCAGKRDKFADKQIIIEMILSGADVKQAAVLKTKVYDTMSYYLPIPEHELLYNQNLLQNPFYDR
ncbi:MAG: RagB/SusD family nutrient uptake outer membrane protein [Prolixibacteraceae bacterium]|nr:RagB/SusD family nutrient uptake outer membrane protein [Prolixibacteraceae bacterium]